MRKFRINNDVPVIWRIVDKQTLMPFDLEGKTVKVALQNRFGIVPIEEFEVSGNVISFIFKAAQQGWLGVYTATVSIVDAEGQTWTADDCQMLELVARSCCVDVCDCQGVNATSCVEFAQFIIVDQELEEGSTNPVAGGPVAEAINGLKRRVFKYHIDEASETPAVIETGDDWINNSAVLDWLFRNGVEGVDKAEVNVPCVIITPTGGSGSAQTILGSTNAVWGEEDGLVYFNALFSSQITQVLASLNAYYSRAEVSTTWNKNQLEVGNLDLQTVEDNPVERGSGNYSLQQKAEPNNENNASGLCSTAFGHSNEATEHCSYVEGYNNASGGWASHVEGVENTATPDAHFSHVGGTESVAGHTCAFVHGRGLRSADEQAVFGMYNAYSPSEAFVVGWGESDGSRRNAFSVPKSVTGTAKVWGESIVAEAKSVSYAELVIMRNSYRLVPGRFYRITDYETTTTQFATRSAGHLFDVIVLALDKNVLSENAWAINSARDTDGYFSNSNLSAWRLKYCLDNDDVRFTWADTENGKGVIYQMEDEFGNIAPYDFKNIQYYLGNVIVVGKYGTEAIALSSPDNPFEYKPVSSFPVSGFIFNTSQPAVGDLSREGGVKVNQAWPIDVAPTVGWVYSSRTHASAGGAELDRTMYIRSLAVAGFSGFLPVIASEGFVRAEEPTPIVNFSEYRGDDIYITTYRGGKGVAVVAYKGSARTDVWGTKMSVGGLSNTTRASMLFELTGPARPYGTPDFEKTVVQADSPPTSSVQLSDTSSSYIIVDDAGTPKEVTFASLAALIPATTTTE